MSEEFTIQYGDIDKVIEYLSKCMDDNIQIKYNHISRMYEFPDGTKISDSFVYDTMTKMSHYINVVSRALMNVPPANIQQVQPVQTNIQRRINNQISKTVVQLNENKEEVKEATEVNVSETQEKPKRKAKKKSATKKKTASRLKRTNKPEED